MPKGVRKPKSGVDEFLTGSLKYLRSLSQDAREIVMGLLQREVKATDWEKAKTKQYAGAKRGPKPGSKRKPREVAVEATPVAKTYKSKSVLKREKVQKRDRGNGTGINPQNIFGE